MDSERELKESVLSERLDGANDDDDDGNVFGYVIFSREPLFLIVPWMDNLLSRFEPREILSLIKYSDKNPW